MFSKDEDQYGPKPQKSELLQCREYGPVAQDWHIGSTVI